MWVESSDGKWSIEASEMGCESASQCPSCKNVVDTSCFQPVPQRGEVEFWRGRCTCGTELTIWND